MEIHWVLLLPRTTLLSAGAINYIFCNPSFACLFSLILQNLEMVVIHWLFPKYLLLPVFYERWYNRPRWCGIIDERKRKVLVLTQSWGIYYWFLLLSFPQQHLICPLVSSSRRTSTTNKSRHHWREGLVLIELSQDWCNGKTRPWKALCLWVQEERKQSLG